MPTTTAAVGQRTMGVVLRPLDILFFRDGRPFGAATHAASRAAPLPQTFAGAIWTQLLVQYGCDFTQLRHRVTQQHEPIGDALDALGLPAWIHRVRVRGPWFARIELDAQKEAPEIMIPTPATLLCPKEDGPAAALSPLRPLPSGTRLPGWESTRCSQMKLRPLWPEGRAAMKPADGFLTARGIRAFLAGETVPTSEHVAADELFAWDHRTGVGIDPTRLAAAESLIYRAQFLALRRDLDACKQTVFYAEVVVPEDAPDDVFDAVDTLAFGGEGRRVAVQRLDHPYDWRALEPQSDRKASGKPLLVLTTPGMFDLPWCPNVIRNRVTAASVPAGVAVSGWDLARGGPKPNRSAVPPGSVYFLSEWIESLPDSLADQLLDRQQGWGCYLTGVWNDD